MSRKLVLGGALACSLVTASRALACAFCAQSQGPRSSGLTLLIGMMLVLPFFLVGVVVRQVMRTEEPPLPMDRLKGDIR